MHKSHRIAQLQRQGSCGRLGTGQDGRLPRQFVHVGAQHSNLAAAKVAPSAEQLKRLDEVSAVPPAYPHTALDDLRIQDLITGGNLDRINRPAHAVA